MEAGQSRPISKGLHSLCACARLAQVACAPVGHGFKRGAWCSRLCWAAPVHRMRAHQRVRPRFVRRKVTLKVLRICALPACAHKGGRWHSASLCDDARCPATARCRGPHSTVLMAALSTRQPPSRCRPLSYAMNTIQGGPRLVLILYRLFFISTKTLVHLEIITPPNNLTNAVHFLTKALK